MPPRDIYHDIIVTALIQAGWLITNDPLRLRWMERKVYIDLAATHIVAATQNNRLIAVEVKNFASADDVSELEKGLGQYILYQTLLEVIEPERSLYLAIPDTAYDEFFKDNPIGEILIRKCGLQFVVYNVLRREILEWIP